MNALVSCSVCALFWLGSVCGSFAATTKRSALMHESGVSFGVAPVATGSGSGDTIYIMSGSYTQRDQNPNGMRRPAWTGVSLWQVGAGDGHAEFLWGDPYGNPGTRVHTGLNQLTGVYSAGVGSLTLVRNSAGGVSIFAVTSNFNYRRTSSVPNRAVTGFTLWGFSHGQNPCRFEESLRVEGEGSGISTAVLFPPAYSSNWMENSRRVSGSSLYFATTSARPYDVGGVLISPLVAGAAAANTGSTIFCLNPHAAGRVTTASPNRVLAYRFESHVSGFACAPVIKEGKSGISVFILGALGPGRGGSGVSLFGYKGTDIDTGVTPAWQYRINVTTNRGLLRARAARLSRENGVTKWPTPCFGKGALAWGSNNHSGDSLFVTDGKGGVSVFNTNTAVAPVSFGERASFVQYYPYSDDRLPSSVTPIASPVCNGRYLVLPSATGVTVYDSRPKADGTGTLLTPGQPKWGREFTRAAGYDARDWYTCGTPLISGSFLVLPITANSGRIGELRSMGRILLIELSEGDIVDSPNVQSGAIAAPIAAGRDVWAVDYNSSAYRITFGDAIRAGSFWGQFKFDASKTGDSTEEDEPAHYDDDSGCFISVLRD